MIYIYIKTHNKTGLKYLGQTQSKNPHSYVGSGKYWRLHLKVHGNDVTTQILRECSTKQEVRHWGEYFSNLFDVVNDKGWANLKPETGDGGSPKGTNLGRSHTEKTRKLISEKKKGIPNPKTAIPRTEKQKNHLRQINTGKTLSIETKEKMRKRMIN